MPSFCTNPILEIFTPKYKAKLTEVRIRRKTDII